jgi:hypothetical protein
MSFLSVFSKILGVTEEVAPLAATAINPAAGAIVGTIVGAVTQAEHSGEDGETKRDMVITNVVPQAMSHILAAMPTAVVDDGKLEDAVGRITDGVVGLMNSVGHGQTESDK